MTKQAGAMVTLRPWAEQDLGLESRLMGDPAMTVYLGGPETAEQLRNRHERYCTLPISGKGQVFVILYGPDQIAAGSVAYWETTWRERPIWEMGWGVLPEFQGRGLATQAAIIAIAHARVATRHRYIHAFPRVDNQASNAVCRKLGMTFGEEASFEYPVGNRIRCNNWYMDIFSSQSADKL